MKLTNLMTLLLALVVSLPLLAEKEKPKDKNYEKVYKDKNFYFSGWGNPKSGTEEEQIKRMQQWADAGITDLLPGAGVERLKELIKYGNSTGIRIHAWHWMMNVGGSKECKEHPEWYSVNRLGQSCRDFHPYVGYYNFLSPFSEGAREYIKRGVREKAQIEGLASVHFDYIRFVDVILGANLQKKYKHNGSELIQDRLLAEYDFGYHPVAREQYKEKFGVDPMDMADVVENPAWQQFRMNAISSLVEECVQICHEEGTAASAAVFPFPQLAREYVRQDWGHWNLDYFFPMVYKKDHEGNMGWVGFATKEGVRDMNPGQLLFTGVLVGHYKDNMADFEEAIVQAHDNGAKGITFFTVGSLTDEHLAIIKRYDEKYNK
ncbi:hypothetical protein [Reichenbachiella sp. MALMAid0571]|uniref:hypothetical protein n=1 Tax=Reichenbachiella sp. MALMAid0571 TaxID=3143939 RepID=UPI0032E03B4D